MAILKRKLQLQGLYPIVYNDHGKMVRIYINRKSAPSDSHQAGTVNRVDAPKVKKRMGKKLRYTKSHQQVNSLPAISKLNQKPTESNPIEITTAKMIQFTTEKSNINFRKDSEVKRNDLSAYISTSTLQPNVVTSYEAEQATTIPTTARMTLFEEVSTTTDNFFSSTIESASTYQPDLAHYIESSEAYESTTVDSSTHDNLMTTTTESIGQETDSDASLQTSTHSSIDQFTEAALDLRETVAPTTPALIDETPDIGSMDYAADDALAHDSVGSVVKIDSFFSDSAHDKYPDEYKMDQLILTPMFRINQHPFSTNEKQVLRSLFRPKWKAIKKEVENLQTISNDVDPVLQELMRQ